jgi:hypothetical protein
MMPRVAAVSGMAGAGCVIRLLRVQIFIHGQKLEISRFIGGERGRIVTKPRDTRILTHVIGIYLTRASCV